MRPLRLLLVVIFVLSSLEVAGQPTPTNTPIRNKIKKITDAIAKYNSVDGKAVGYAGVRSEQWNRYEKLEQDATDAELITLTDNTNSVVRCYAFQALVNRKSPNALPVLAKHLKDTASVDTCFGCIIGSEKVSDYFLSVVAPSYADLPKDKLTADQKADIQQIMISRKILK